MMAETQAVEREFEPNDYNRAVGQCQLLSISLMKGHFEVKPEIHDPEKPRNLHYDADVQSVRYSPEYGALSGIFSFAISAKKGRKIALKGGADFIVIYRAPSDLEPRAAEAFCKHVGALAAYPYFRAWAAQSAWAANVDLPPLPMLSTTGKPPLNPPKVKGA